MVCFAKGIEMAPDALESRVDRLEAALVRLAEAQARTEERLAQLTARMDDLVAGLMQLAARVDDLAAAQVRTENQIALLARETGHLKGWTLEVQYRDKAFAYFQPILRRISAVSHEDLETLADRAEDKGVLSPHDHADLLHADVVIRGQRIPRVRSMGMSQALAGPGDWLDPGGFGANVSSKKYRTFFKTRMSSQRYHSLACL